jgi:hypothetical protein
MEDPAGEEELSDLEALENEIVANGTFVGYDPISKWAWYNVYAYRGTYYAIHDWDQRDTATDEILWDHGDVPALLARLRSFPPG